MHMLLIDGEMKPGRQEEFLEIWNNKILPSLKKQNGFIDEMVLFESGTTRAVGLSFWQTKQDADRYAREVFPNGVEFAGHLISVPPTISNFEVAVAETFKIARRTAA